MSRRRGSSAGGRWELSDEEVLRLRAAGGLTPRRTARILLRHPRILKEALKAARSGAVEGVMGRMDLVWVLDGEATRQVVPDVATGVLWGDAGPFLAPLRPYFGLEVRALEIGCGAGRIGRLVAPHVRELVCSDVSEIMLDEARENLRGIDNVSFTRTDRFTLRPLSDDAFDLAFAQGVFSYLELSEAYALIDAVHRVLRPGGVLGFNYYNLDRERWAARMLADVRSQAARGRFGVGQWRPYLSEQYEALLRGAGFEVIERHYEGDEETEGLVPAMLVARA